MKIQMDNKNQKGPQTKFILGVVGVVVVVAVIVVGGMFITTGKSPDDTSQENAIGFVDGEEDLVDGEDVNNRNSKDVDNKKVDETKTDEDSKGEDVADEDSKGGDVTDTLPIKPDKDGTLGYESISVTEKNIGPEGKTIAVKEHAIGDTVKLGKFEVTINSAKTVKTDDGKDAVVIDYNLKNKIPKSANWSTAILTHVSQDGKELFRANVKGANDADIKNVKGNNTMKGIKDAFVIVNDKQIYLEVTELLSNDFERALFVFDVPTK